MGAQWHSPLHQPLTLVQAPQAIDLHLPTVDLGVANEPCHRQVIWFLVKILRAVVLQNLTGIHHGHTVRQSQGFGLVMGHIQKRGFQPMVQVGQLVAHLDTQLGIQVGQRLIHQKNRWRPHHGPGQGHTLFLPAGELARLAIQQCLNLQALGGGHHKFFNLPFGRMVARPEAAQQGLSRPKTHARHHQRGGYVLAHRHVRVERIVLKHHGDVALVGFEPNNRLRIELHVALVGMDQASDDAQQCGLATTGWSEQGHKFARLNVQRNLVQDLGLPERLRYVGQFEGCAHG